MPRESKSRFWFRTRARKLAYAGCGIALLVFCTYWWVSSVRLGKLRSGHRTWIPTYDSLCLDFQLNYYGVQLWCEGGNPYDGVGVPNFGWYNYAPAVLWLFAWCRSLDWPSAVKVLIAALGLIAALSGVFAWQSRRRLGISDLPLPYVVGLVVCSTPIIFAMERGNCDLLVLLFMMAALYFMPAKTLTHDTLVGSCLALAMWVKPYAGMLLLGLLSARRPRAALCLAVAIIVIGAINVNGTVQFAHNLREDAKAYDIGPKPSAHPLSTYWWHLWRDTSLARLAIIPGMLAAVACMLPLALWVSFDVFCSSRRELLLYPYFCWLTALGTFVPQISNDYNLFFLPLAALAVWDKRDPLSVHLLMAPMLLWWQPFYLPIGADLLFYFKLSGLVAVGISLVVRARERVEGVKSQGEQEPAAMGRMVAKAA
jgi:hypothetical protein